MSDTKIPAVNTSKGLRDEVCVEFAGGPVTGGTSTLARLVDGHRSTADKARMSAGPRESTVCMSAVVDGFQPDFV